MKKGKMLVSLIAVLMITLVIGNVYSLATENNAGTLKITANTNSTANNTTNNTTNKTTNNSVPSTVNGTNTTNNTAKNATNNTSKYNTTNSTSLPKAGTDTTIVFLVIAFAASTIYAYKKVSDYNI